MSLVFQKSQIKPKINKPNKNLGSQVEFQKAKFEKI